MLPRNLILDIGLLSWRGMSFAPSRPVDHLYRIGPVGYVMMNFWRFPSHNTLIILVNLGTIQGDKGHGAYSAN